mgnify:CR=1 FL=1
MPSYLLPLYVSHKLPLHASFARCSCSSLMRDLPAAKGR